MYSNKTAAVNKVSMGIDQEFIEYTQIEKQGYANDTFSDSIKPTQPDLRVP